MKKIKSLALLAVFAGAMFYSPNAEALPKKKKYTFVHVFSNGCVGTQTVIVNGSGTVVGHEYEVFAYP